MNFEQYIQKIKEKKEKWLRILFPRDEYHGHFKVFIIFYWITFHCWNQSPYSSILTTAVTINSTGVIIGNRFSINAYSSSWWIFYKHCQCVHPYHLLDYRVLLVAIIFCSRHSLKVWNIGTLNTKYKSGALVWCLPLRLNKIIEMIFITIGNYFYMFSIMKITISSSILPSLMKKKGRNKIWLV